MIRYLSGVLKTPKSTSCVANTPEFSQLRVGIFLLLLVLRTYDVGMYTKYDVRMSNPHAPPACPERLWGPWQRPTCVGHAWADLELRMRNGDVYF